MNDTQGRISGLDGLRAISILMVVAFHVGYRSPDELSEGCVNIFPAGVYGVTVFFVISGFLITHLLCLEERRYGRISLSAFYYRRAFRILPPALAYLAITAPLSTRTDIWHCLLFVRNFFPGNGTTAHFWSLSLEEQFYLFWPACFILLRTNRNRLFAIVPTLIAFVAWKHFASHIPGIDRTWFDGSLRHDAIVASLLVIRGQYPILTGCCLALLRHEGLLKWKWLASWWTALVSLLILCAAFVDVAPSSTIPILISIIINVVCRSESFLDWAPLVWVGKLSYSLYLWQEVFCFQSTLLFVGAFPLNVVASLAVACASYYGLEKPTLRLRDRIMSPARSKSYTAAH